MGGDGYEWYGHAPKQTERKKSFGKEDYQNNFKLTRF